MSRSWVQQHPLTWALLNCSMTWVCLLSQRRGSQWSLISKFGGREILNLLLVLWQRFSLFCEIVYPAMRNFFYRRESKVPHRDRTYDLKSWQPIDEFGWLYKCVVIHFWYNSSCTKLPVSTVNWNLGKKGCVITQELKFVWGMSSLLAEVGGCSNTANPVVSPGKLKINPEAKLNV